MRIDPDVTIAHLIRLWKMDGRGNREAVINALETDHPGLTAVLIVQGCSDLRLDRRDANIIANMLIDRRVAALAQQDKTLADATIIEAVTEAINATVALERAQSAAGDDRKRPRYERAIKKLLATALRREPTDAEVEEVLS